MPVDERDLEIQKLKSEIEKTKISGRYSLAATFFGTFLVAVIASYLTFVTDTSRNEQVFDSGHREFVSKFVEIAIDEDIERRQRLAKYFASVTLDETQRSRWKEYSDYVDNLIEENPNMIAKLEAEFEQASSAERQRILSRISFLEKQLRSNAEDEIEAPHLKRRLAEIRAEILQVYNFELPICDENTELPDKLEMPDGINAFGQADIEGAYEQFRKNCRRFLVLSARRAQIDSPLNAQ